jgi:hypothetical protein
MSDIIECKYYIAMNAYTGMIFSILWSSTAKPQNENSSPIEGVRINGYHRVSLPVNDTKGDMTIFARKRT